jgi:hypothetical protein
MMKTSAWVLILCIRKILTAKQDFNATEDTGRSQIAEKAPTYARRRFGIAQLCGCTLPGPAAWTSGRRRPGAKFDRGATAGDRAKGRSEAVGTLSVGSFTVHLEGRRLPVLRGRAPRIFRQFEQPRTGLIINDTGSKGSITSRTG